MDSLSEMALATMSTSAMRENHVQVEYNWVSIRLNKFYRKHKKLIEILTFVSSEGGLASVECQHKFNRQ